MEVKPSELIQVKWYYGEEPRPDYAYYGGEYHGIQSLNGGSDQIKLTSGSSPCCSSCNFFITKDNPLKSKYTLYEAKPIAKPEFSDSSSSLFGSSTFGSSPKNSGLSFGGSNYDSGKTVSKDTQTSSFSFGSTPFGASNSSIREEKSLDAKQTKSFNFGSSPKVESNTNTSSPSSSNLKNKNTSTPKIEDESKKSSDLEDDILNSDSCDYKTTKSISTSKALKNLGTLIDVLDIDIDILPLKSKTDETPKREFIENPDENISTVDALLNLGYLLERLNIDIKIKNKKDK